MNINELCTYVILFTFSLNSGPWAVYLLVPLLLVVMEATPIGEAGETAITDRNMFTHSVITHCL